MNVKIVRIFCTCLIFLNSLKITAQDTLAHIDPSKPTNFYKRMTNSLEYNFTGKNRMTYGYRGNLVWASPNQHHSAQLEVPLLYATSSEKFGLGDLRFRYYWVPYKDYSKKPGAFGFAFDSYLPTGSYKNGLGRGRWIASTGLSTAFVFGKFSAYPIVSYLYSSEVTEASKGSQGTEELHGYMIQSIFVYKFNKKSYLDCTPSFMKNSYSNAGKDDLVLEGNYLYMIKPNKMQIGCFFRRYFYGDATTLRASMRIYF